MKNKNSMSKVWFFNFPNVRTNFKRLCYWKIHVSGKWKYFQISRFPILWKVLISHLAQCIRKFPVHISALSFYVYTLYTNIKILSPLTFHILFNSNALRPSQVQWAWTRRRKWQRRRHSTLIWTHTTWCTPHPNPNFPRPTQSCVHPMPCPLSRLLPRESPGQEEEQGLHQIRESQAPLHSQA